MQKKEFDHLLNILIEKELKKQSDEKKSSKEEPILKNPPKQTVSNLPDPSSDISIGGNPYKLSLDVNKNPTKKGIKIQFLPVNNTELDSTKKRDLQINLLKKINEGLKQYGMEADIDPDVPYPNVIGIYIRLQFFDKLIRDILKTYGTQNSSKEETTT